MESHHHPGVHGCLVCLAMRCSKHSGSAHVVGGTFAVTSIAWCPRALGLPACSRAPKHSPLLRCSAPVLTAQHTTLCRAPPWLRRSPQHQDLQRLASQVLMGQSLGLTDLQRKMESQQATLAELLKVGPARRLSRWQGRALLVSQGHAGQLRSRAGTVQPGTAISGRAAPPWPQRVACRQLPWPAAHCVLPAGCSP